MEKLKKNSIEKIIIFYILIQPILDVATSLCLEYINPYLTLGIFIRTIFMGAIIIYSLIKSNKRNRIKSFIYYALVGIYMCTFLLVSYMQNGTNMILAQIKGLVRAFYFPLVLTALYNLVNSNNIKIENKYFIWALAEYCLIILIAKLTGIAYPTYRYGFNLGTVGLFYAANETGAILSILSPVLAIELLKNNKTNIINIITSILLIFSILEMGTKVPLIAFIILFLLFFIICVIKIFTQEEKKKYIYKVLFSIVIFLFIVFTIGYSPVGKNLESNYGIEFIDISFNRPSITEEKPKTEEPNVDSEDEKTVEIDVTDIVSGRNELLKKNLERYTKSNMPEKIFGNGYLTYRNNELQTNKLVEIDYFDIFFSHGAVGALLLFAPLVFILIKLAIKTIKRLIGVIKDEEAFIYWYAIGIGLGITLAAGHVLTAPAVSIYMILLLLNLNKYLEKFEVKN